MLENLKTTRYNDGIPITQITGNADWISAISGAYCIYDLIPENNDKYGKLYNWKAVNTGKLAPIGWHVATDNDFILLSTFLGGGTEAGGKMKSLNLWNSPNTGATNSSYFSGLPGGYRDKEDGKFKELGYSGYFWTSTSVDITYNWCRILFYDNAIVSRESRHNRLGMSVGCVKD